MVFEMASFFIHPLCRYTNKETTLCKTLNHEPDACYNPNNYKIRNNIESQIQKQHLTRMLNPKPGPCYNPNM